MYLISKISKDFLPPGAVYSAMSPDSFADQGFGQRRRQGYFVLFDICLIVADNLVLFFFIGIFVNHLNGGAETDNVSFGVGDVNNLGTA